MLQERNMQLGQSGVFGANEPAFFEENELKV